MGNKIPSLKMHVTSFKKSGYLDMPKWQQIPDFPFMPPKDTHTERYV